MSASAPRFVAPLPERDGQTHHFAQTTPVVPPQHHSATSPRSAPNPVSPSSLLSPTSPPPIIQVSSHNDGQPRIDVPFSSPSPPGSATPLIKAPPTPPGGKSPGLPPTSVSDAVAGRKGTPPPARNTFTEEQLRKMYENDEVQRFLELFHSRVNEVTLLDPDAPIAPKTGIEVNIGQPSSNTPRVVVSTDSAAASPPGSASSPSGFLKPPGSVGDVSESSITEDESDSDDDEEEEEEIFWVNPDGEDTMAPEPSSFREKVDRINPKPAPNVSEVKKKTGKEPIWWAKAAADWITPRLPRDRALDARNLRAASKYSNQSYSFSALHVSAQRLYFALYPIYTSAFFSLYDLALWRDSVRSHLLCTLFWIAWYYDVILPCFLLAGCLHLLKRRLLPYPTYNQLQARRKAAREAEEFSTTIFGYTRSNARSNWKDRGLGLGGASLRAAENFSGSHIDAIRLFWLLAKPSPRSRKLRRPSDADQRPEIDKDEDFSGLSPEEMKEVEDWRKNLIIVADELADLHERLKNWVLWRNSEASMKYTLILAALTTLATITPQRYIVKAGYGTIGFFYWFIIPTIFAMTPKQRQRIPPPLYDVPTDADYAIQLISRKLAAGEDIYNLTDENHVPTGSRPLRHAPSSPHISPTSMKNQIGKAIQKAKTSSKKGLAKLASNPPSPLLSATSPDSSKGPSAANISTWAEGSSQVNISTISLDGSDSSGDASKEDERYTSTPLQPRSSPNPDMLIIPSSNSAPSTTRNPPISYPVYSAQCELKPGMITFEADQDQIAFTSFKKLVTGRGNSTSNSLQIPLSGIRGLKKVGRFKGMEIRYLPRDATPGDEQTVKFRWVVHRDELFTRILGSCVGKDGKPRWIRV